MKYEKVVIFLEIVGSIFIVISILEIVYVVLLHFTPFILDGNLLSLFEFIYSSTIFPLSGTLLWLFMIISMFGYLILGIFLFKLSSTKKIESGPLAKYIVVIGMVILLGGFVKMNYFVLLGKSTISTTYTTISFQNALYNTSITGIMPAIFWIYFMSVNCAIMITGLVVTAVGIKWTLLQEAEKS
jgi:hypothetical protein